MATVFVADVKNFIKSIDYNKNSKVDTKTYYLDNNGNTINPKEAKELQKKGELGCNRKAINEASLFNSWVDSKWGEMDSNAQSYANDIGYYLCQGESY